MVCVGVKVRMRKRFFVQDPHGEAVLSGEEFNHAKNVLRLSVGDEVVLFDGDGKEYSAVIAKLERNRFVLHVTGETVSDKEPKQSVYLLLGALKGDKTEFAVQKATELGVTKIGIFSSEFCSAYMNDNKLSRLNRVAHEAAKQCLRASVPEVVYFSSFEQALRSAEDCPCKLFACEFAKESDEGFSALTAPAALVVGSEGGFSEQEFSLARSLGYAGVTLGKRILRAETAAIALTAIVMYRLGELQ